MDALPKEIKINLWELLEKTNHKDEFWDMISEYLSDEYGYCHNGYCLNEDIEINITDIDWDTEE